MLSRGSANRTLEVTLVQHRDAPPLDASHIAQQNQRASGNNSEREQAPRASQSLLPPAPAQQDRPAQPAGAASREASARVVSASRNSEERLPQSDDRPGDTRTNPTTERLQALQARLASLEASLHNEDDARSAAPRVRRLTAVAAKSAVDAAYLQDWRQRLEAVGNTYYPEASLRYGMFGSLRLLVVIRSDGSLEDVSLLSSSGYAVLDEAAIRIVRMAAPYAPFPPELKATTDKLEIVRTWKFERNTLSSAEEP